MISSLMLKMETSHLEQEILILKAVGGGQDGQFLAKEIATRVDYHRLHLMFAFKAEKILIKSDNQINIISKGFLELKSGFTLSASFADDNFGTMSKV